MKRTKRIVVEVIIRCSEVACMCTVTIGIHFLKKDRELLLGSESERTDVKSGGVIQLCAGGFLQESEKRHH